MIAIPLWMSYTILFGVLIFVIGFWFYGFQKLFKVERKIEAEPENKGPVFCRDCKHFLRYSQNESLSQCGRTAKMKEDPYYLVTGRTKLPEVEYSFCNVQRLSDYDKKCGPNGKYFEPKVF